MAVGGQQVSVMTDSDLHLIGWTRHPGSLLPPFKCSLYAHSSLKTSRVQNELHRIHFHFWSAKATFKTSFFWRIFPEASNHVTCIACPKLHLFREIRSFSPWCLKFTSRVHSMAGYADGDWEVWKWWTRTIIQPPPSPTSNVELLTPYTEESYLLISLCFPVTLTPTNQNFYRWLILKQHRFPHESNTAKCASRNIGHKK